MQQAAHHGCDPSEFPPQYLQEGLPSVQTAPGHPRGKVGPFIDGGNSKQVDTGGGGGPGEGTSA